MAGCIKGAAGGDGDGCLGDSGQGDAFQEGSLSRPGDRARSGRRRRRCEDDGGVAGQASSLRSVHRNARDQSTAGHAQSRRATSRLDLGRGAQGGCAVRGFAGYLDVRQ